MGFLDTLGKKAFEATGKAIKASSKAVKDHKEEIAAIGSALKKGADFTGNALCKTAELMGKTMEKQQRAIDREIRRRGM